MNKVVKVDTGCTEFGAEMVPWVDENKEVILADGAAKEQKAVPSAGDTPKEEGGLLYQTKRKEMNLLKK
jgi:hypothetical protein